MSFPKSLRSIEIEQKCSFGFTVEFVKKLLDEHKSSIRDYAWICHNKDNDDHIHLMMWFYNPIPVDNILKWIVGVGSISQLERIKKDESAIAYLTHSNCPNKVQYDVNDVHTNMSLTTITTITERAKKLSNVQPLLDDIINGKMSEKDFFRIENGEIYLKHKRKIDDAFDFYYKCKQKEVLSMEKDITVIFIDGDSRTGKTSYIVEQCKNLNVPYCKSSSSNDILQDYVDEEILILDDLRDDALKMSDFLKFTDPHVRSTTQSRYHNKCFMGSIIYITTTKPFDTWYQNCKDEQRIQFTARIKERYHFTRDDIEVYRHKDNDDKSPFECVGIFPNIMKDKYASARNSSYEFANKLMNAITSQKAITRSSQFVDAGNVDIPFSVRNE